MKTQAFKRLERELPSLSKHLRLKKIKLGFYRIFFKEAHIHEVYEEMPMLGYDLEVYDPRFESQQYFEEFEDNAELIRKVKNYVEGYYDAIQTIRTRVYLMKNDNEFYNTATNAYKNLTVK